VVFRFDDSVGCAALAGDVTVKVAVSFRDSLRGALLSQLCSWKHLQVDEFSLVIFHDGGWFAVNLVVEGAFLMVRLRSR
jgi:hypothetical protein